MTKEPTAPGQDHDETAKLRPEASPEEETIAAEPLETPEAEQGAGAAEPGPAPGTGETTSVEPPSHEARTFAMLAHLLGGLLVLTVWFAFLAPLVIWLIKKDEMPFVADQAKEALNFQLMVLIGMVVASGLTVITCGFGALLLLPLIVVDIVMSIMAAVKANEGVLYRYPINLRMVQ